MWGHLKNPRFYFRLLLTFLAYLAVYSAIRALFGAWGGGTRFFASPRKLLLFCAGMSLLLTLTRRKDSESIEDKIPDDLEERRQRGLRYYAGFFSLLVLLSSGFLALLLALAALLFWLLGAGDTFRRGPVGAMVVVVVLLCLAYTVYTWLADRSELRRLKAHPPERRY